MPKIIHIVHQSSAEADLGFSLRGLLLVKIKKSSSVMSGQAAHLSSGSEGMLPRKMLRF